MSPPTPPSRPCPAPPGDGSVWHLLKGTLQAFIDDGGSSRGAALAYYTLFSAAPLLLIVIGVAGLVFGPDAARGEIFEQLRGLMGPTGAAAIQALLESVNQPHESLGATALGIVLTLIGATSVLAELQRSLDQIWCVPTPPSSGPWSLVRARLLGLGLILCLGFLLAVSLVLSAGIAATMRWWSRWFGEWALLVEAVNQLLSVGLMAVVFALIYKILPSAKVRWADVGTGALFTALLFTIGKGLIGWYIGTSSVASGFGAAGSFVVVLIWVYYSAQIFLLGAEFTWIHAQQRQGLRRAASPVAAGPQPVQHKHRLRA